MYIYYNETQDLRSMFSFLDKMKNNIYICENSSIYRFFFWFIKRIEACKREILEMAT